MITKLENLVSVLDKNDIENLSGLILTAFFGGNQSHLEFLNLMLSQNFEKRKQPIHINNRLIMSDLCKMIENYLVIKEVKISQFEKDKILLKYYRTHEKEKLFNECFKKSENFLEKSAYKNSRFYDHLSSLLFEKWQFDQISNRFSNTDINQIIINSNVAEISKKLEQLITLTPQSVIISKKTETSYFEYLEPFIIENNLLQYPCIALFYFAFKMLVNPEEKTWFENFENHLALYENQFSDDELRTLYFQAINYCIRKHNGGIKEFSSRLLQYYKIGLQKGYFLINGHLSKNTYRNICTIAIRLNMIEDAINISDNYRHLLRKDEETSAYHFNLASIYYEQQLFDKGLELLREVNFDDHLANLFAKTLMLKIYFESKEHRLLDSHLDAMQVYLTRKKLTGTYKANYSNVIKYAKKLNKLNPYDKSERLKLKEQIRNEMYLPDKNWFLQQTENQ